MSKDILKISTYELQYNSGESTLSEYSCSSIETENNISTYRKSSFLDLFKMDLYDSEEKQGIRNIDSNSDLAVETCISLAVGRDNKYEGPGYFHKTNFEALLSTLTDSTLNTSFHQNKEKKTKNYELKNLSQNTYQLNQGNFANIIKSKNGSTSIQKYLDTASPKIITKIFNEILFDIPSLMTDHYGNYICQKLYKLLNVKERLLFLQQLRNNIIYISNNNVGIFPLQKIIDEIYTDEEKFIIIDSIANERVLSTIIKNHYGVHLIEKLLSNYTDREIIFIYTYILNNFDNLSLNSTGLIVMKKIVKQATSFQIIKSISEKMLRNFDSLVQHPIGNIIVQEAIRVIIFLI